jgi:hypothetical protein
MYFSEVSLCNKLAKRQAPAKPFEVGEFSRIFADFP